MSLLDSILTRRSIRKCEKKKIPEEIPEKILEAGRQTPSAGNRKLWRFIVIANDETKQELSHGRWNTFVRDSAATIADCAYTGDSYSLRWPTIDTTIALQNVVIAAWVVRVGSCWVGNFREGEVKRLFNIPDDWKVI